MPDVDKIEMKDSGKFLVILDGVKHTLSRPKIGDLQAIDEAIDEVADLEREVLAEKEPGEGSERKPDKEVIRKLDQERMTGMLDLWRLIFKRLSDHADDFPEDNDDLPAFMLQGVTISDLKKHWLTVPWGPGGSPTQQEASRAMAELTTALKPLQRNA